MRRLQLKALAGDTLAETAERMFDIQHIFAEKGVTDFEVTTTFNGVELSALDYQQNPKAVFARPPYRKKASVIVEDYFCKRGSDPKQQL